MWNQLKTVFLLGTLSVLMVAIGGYLGPGYLYFFGALAALMSFGSYFWSDKIVLKMQRARELTSVEAPSIHRMVEELSERAGIPKPRIYLVPESQPNAFATGRNPEHAAVAVTEGIMKLLNERELRGVLAHELAHIKNRDILIATIAAAIATAVTYIANVVQFSAFFGGGGHDEEEGSPWAALLFAVLAPIGASLIQLGISRSREYEADATGARISGDPEALARALERLHGAAEHIPADVQPATASLFIVNPLASPLSGGRRFSELFSTHPDVEERVRRLREMRHLARAA